MYIVSFQQTDVALISIAFDSMAEQQQAAREYGISVPMVIDADHRISEAYDVLKWAVASGEPGHTFILVDETISYYNNVFTCSGALYLLKAI